MTITTDVTWRRLREMVKKRDKSTCFHCGTVDENGQCDHLMPLAKGGTDSIMNLVWSCTTCNARKKDKYSFDDGTMPPWVVKEEPPAKSKWDKIDDDVDNFMINLLKLTLRALVPPYQKYTWPRYANYREYFVRVIFERITFPVTTILRQLIYPMPEEIKGIYTAFDKLREFEKYLIKKGRLDKNRIGVGVCPTCESDLFGKWVDHKDKSMTLEWHCPNGHRGKSEFNSGEHNIRELYTAAIRDVFNTHHADDLMQFYSPIIVPTKEELIHPDDYQI